MNQVERFLKMGEWGCNVSNFVKNPYQCWGVDTFGYLKKRFYYTKHLNIVAFRQADKQSKSFAKRGLPEAFWITFVLEGVGYDVIITESFPCDYLGFASLNSNYSGDFCTQETGDDTMYAFSFDDYRNLIIGDMKKRHILRELFKTQKKAGKTLYVFFGWAKDFVGIHHARLVFFDFSFTKSLIFSGN